MDATAPARAWPAAAAQTAREVDRPGSTRPRTSDRPRSLRAHRAAPPTARESTSRTIVAAPGRSAGDEGRRREGPRRLEHDQRRSLRMFGRRAGSCTRPSRGRRARPASPGRRAAPGRRRTCRRRSRARAPRSSRAAQVEHDQPTGAARSGTAAPLDQCAASRGAAAGARPRRPPRGGRATARRSCGCRRIGAPRRHVREPFRHLRHHAAAVRVHVVDPSAYTPPYDRALCAALAARRRGRHAGHQPLRLRRGAAGRGLRGRRALLPARCRPAGTRRGWLAKLAEHVPDMLRYRRAARDGRRRALPVADRPADRRPPAPARPPARADRARRPAARAAPGPARAPSAASTSASTRSSCTPSTAASGWSVELGLDRPSASTSSRTARSSTCTSARRQPLPPELARRRAARSSSLFGLLRPYKGLDVLLDAWRGRRRGAELWVVGMPRMALGRRGRRPSVRLVPRFVTDAELAALVPRAPTSSCCPTGRSTSPACSVTALAFGRPLLLSDVGGFPEVAATGAAELVAPGDAGGAARRAARCSATPAAARRWPRRRARPRPRPTRGTASPRATSSSTRRFSATIAAVTALAIVFWASAGAARLRPASATRCAAGGARAAAPRAGAPAAATPTLPTRLADRRRLRRGGGDRRQGRERARARLPARAARGDRRRCDGSPDGTARRARAPAPTLVLELPRGGKVRAQDAAVERAERRDRRVLGRQRDAGSPTRCARSSRRSPTRAVGYVCGQVRFVNDGGTNQEGLYWRYEMALRALESRLRSVTGGNGAIYATRREAYIVVDPIMGHDLSFPFNMVKRGWRARLRAGGARDGEDGADDRGRVRAQAADDEPRLADRPARRDARRRAATALLRADDRLATACCATSRRSCTWSRSARTPRCSARARLLVALASSWRSSRPRWRAAPAAPLLVARYYVLTTASLAAGLLDWLRHGTPPAGSRPEGTR